MSSQEALNQLGISAHLWYGGAAARWPHPSELNRCQYLFSRPHLLTYIFISSMSSLNDIQSLTFPLKGILRRVIPSLDYKATLPRLCPCGFQGCAVSHVWWWLLANLPLPMISLCCISAWDSAYLTTPGQWSLRHLLQLLKPLICSALGTSGKVNLKWQWMGEALGCPDLASRWYYTISFLVSW